MFSTLLGFVVQLNKLKWYLNNIVIHFPCCGFTIYQKPYENDSKNELPIFK